MDHELSDVEGVVRIEDLMRACRLREETARHSDNCIHQAWHDLKESLHVIRVAGTLIKAKAADEDSRNIADYVMSASGDLNCLLTDLADFARLESGSAERSLSTFEVGWALREVATNLRGLLQAKKAALKLDAGAPMQVYSDCTKVQRIAENLIRYCLKQGHASEMECSWRRVPPHWTVEVQATIAGDFQPVLGERINLAVARGFCTVLEGTLTLGISDQVITGQAQFPLEYPAA